jgi:hypothetical protein
MPPHPCAQRAPRRRAASDPPFVNSAIGPDGEDGNDELLHSNGWFDSSFELRQGLDVIEWVLPELGPGQKPPQ